MQNIYGIINIRNMMHDKKHMINLAKMPDGIYAHVLDVVSSTLEENFRATIVRSLDGTEHTIIGDTKIVEDDDINPHIIWNIPFIANKDFVEIYAPKGTVKLHQYCGS